jgi:hypothetical protein
MFLSASLIPAAFRASDLMPPQSRIDRRLLLISLRLQLENGNHNENR